MTSLENPVELLEPRPVASGVEHLRAAQGDEAAAAAELLDRFNREFDTPTPGPEVLARRLHAQLASEQTLAILAGRPPCGLAVATLRPNVWFDGSVALLDELYVEPDHRRRGIGSALLHAAEQACRSRGCALMEINVDGGDLDARRFYERHGYSSGDADQPELYYSRHLS